MRISKSPPPCAVLEGESEETEGEGLLGPVMVNVVDRVATVGSAMETLTLAVPAVAIRSLVI